MGIEVSIKLHGGSAYGQVGPSLKPSPLTITLVCTTCGHKRSHRVEEPSADWSNVKPIEDEFRSTHGTCVSIEGLLSTVEKMCTCGHSGLDHTKRGCEGHGWPYSDVPQCSCRVFTLKERQT